MKKYVFTFIILVILGACNTGVTNNRNSGIPELKVAEMEGVKKLYKKNCALCHGMNGKKGFSGAKDLSTSKLSVEERIMIISEGKNAMMPYKGILSPDQIDSLAAFTLTLKE